MDVQRRNQILIVEDEVLVAMHVEDLVIAMGHEIVGPATRLGEALKLARQTAIDFAILDVNLAGESSAPVAEILRERGIPFVFATGYGSEGAALAQCQEPTLRKPYAAHELKLAIAEGIEMRRRVAARDEEGDKLLIVAAAPAAVGPPILAAQPITTP
jgi:CheY-like chemotaxis protein